MSKLNLEDKTTIALWSFLTRLDEDTLDSTLRMHVKGYTLSEAEIEKSKDIIVDMKGTRIDNLDTDDCEALRALLSRAGADTIESVLSQKWAGIQLTKKQIEEYRFEIFRFYSLCLYIPFQDKKK